MMNYDKGLKRKRRKSTEFKRASCKEGKVMFSVTVTANSTGRVLAGRSKMCASFVNRRRCTTESAARAVDTFKYQRK